MAAPIPVFLAGSNAPSGAGCDNTGHVCFDGPVMTPRAFLATLLAGFLASAAWAADPVPPAKPVDLTPRLAYGQLLKYGEKVVFAPCRDRSYVIVEDTSPLGRVTQGLRAAGLESGRKIYAELLGVVGEDGILKASDFNLARTEGRCQQPGGEAEAWRAGGHGPGWSLVAGPEGILLHRAGTTDLLFPYTPFRREGERVSHAVAHEGQTLSLRFEQGLCEDKAAESVFGWTATVTLGEQTLTGCAWAR